MKKSFLTVLTISVLMVGAIVFGACKKQPASAQVTPEQPVVPTPISIVGSWSGEYTEAIETAVNDPNATLFQIVRLDYTFYDLDFKLVTRIFYEINGIVVNPHERGAETMGLYDINGQVVTFSTFAGIETGTGVYNTFDKTITIFNDSTTSYVEISR